MEDSYMKSWTYSYPSQYKFKTTKPVDNYIHTDVSFLMHLFNDQLKNTWSQ